MNREWAACIAMVALVLGCRTASEQDTDTCPSCTDGEGNPGGNDTMAPADSATYYATPAGEYAYDPDCNLGGYPIPTVYYVHTYSIDGSNVTGTDEMVWVSHPSTGIPVCSFSWPVTGTAGPCDACDLRVQVHTGDATNDGCSEDRAHWGPTFANADTAWFVTNGTGDAVAVTANPPYYDDGHPGTLVDGVLAFASTQCNGL